jgi:hypothetical protein
VCRVIVAGVSATAAKPPLPNGAGGNEHSTKSFQLLSLLIADFCNKICH